MLTGPLGFGDASAVSSCVPRARFKADVYDLAAWGDCKVAIDPANMFMTGGDNSGPIPGVAIALRPDAAVEVELAAGFVLTQVDAIVVLDAAAAENRAALEWLATEQVQHAVDLVYSDSALERWCQSPGLITLPQRIDRRGAWGGTPH